MCVGCHVGVRCIPCRTVPNSCCLSRYASVASPADCQCALIPGRHLKLYTALPVGQKCGYVTLVARPPTVRTRAANMTAGVRRRPHLHSSGPYLGGHSTSASVCRQAVGSPSFGRRPRPLDSGGSTISIYMAHWRLVAELEHGKSTGRKGVLQVRRVLHTCTCPSLVPINARCRVGG